jgi:hypothetical protein
MNYKNLRYELLLNTGQSMTLPMHSWEEESQLQWKNWWLLSLQDCQTNTSSLQPHDSIHRISGITPTFCKVTNNNSLHRGNQYFPGLHPGFTSWLQNPWQVLRLNHLKQRNIWKTLQVITLELEMPVRHEAQLRTQDLLQVHLTPQTKALEWEKLKHDHQLHYNCRPRK